MEPTHLWADGKNRTNANSLPVVTLPVVDNIAKTQHSIVFCFGVCAKRERGEQSKEQNQFSFHCWNSGKRTWSRGTSLYCVSSRSFISWSLIAGIMPGVNLHSVCSPQAPKS